MKKLSFVALVAAVVCVVSLGGGMAQAQGIVQTTYATGMNSPANISFDASGALFAGEFNGNSVFRAPPGGGAGASYVTAAGGAHSAIIGPDGGLYVVLMGTGNVVRYPAGSTTVDAVPYATGFPGNSYFAIAFDSAGRLYAVGPGQTSVYRASATGGAFSPFATGLGLQSFSLAFDAAQNLYVADRDDRNIYRVTPAGVAAAFGTHGQSSVLALAVGPDNRVYVVGYTNDTIHVIPTTGGAATPYFTMPSGAGVTALGYKGNTLYVGNFDRDTVYAIEAAPAPVPTMTEWAMLLFGTVLAGGAALYIQRRHFTV